MTIKYFSSLCNMNDTDLRANPFHHSCLVFYKATCDESNNITSPLQVINAYGFYSHPVPGKKSLFEDPFTFFTQKFNIDFRLRGSFGEWKHESIHDLTYGRGLTGRLFEMDKLQISTMIASIQKKIQYQQDFFHQIEDTQEREDIYSASLNNRVVELAEDGMDLQVALTQAKEEIHLPEFRFGFYSDGYTCKVAALNILESHADMDNKKIAAHMQRLRENSAIPRFTHDLNNIVIHGMTDQWESRGNQAKYPYCSWDEISDSSKSSLIVVDFGGQYIDMDGNVKTVFGLSSHGLAVIDGLKSIGRLCEINIKDPDYKIWHENICHYIYSIASSKNDKQQNSRVSDAEEYLVGLIGDDVFQNKIKGNIPKNLINRIEQTLLNYGSPDNLDDEVLRIC